MLRFRTSLALGAATLAASILAPLPAGALVSASERPIASPVFAAKAAAFGSSLSGNDTMNSGPSAPAYVCTAKGRRVSENFLAATSYDAPITVRGLNSRTATSKSESGLPVVRSVSRAAGIDLGDGALSIGAIEAIARVEALPGGGFEQTATTSIGSLEVDGLPLDLPLPVQELEGYQVIPVPGVGTVELNIQRKFKPSEAGAGARAIAVKITMTDGSVLRVGRANASLVPDFPTVVNGRAYALNASLLDGLVQVGDVAAQPLPCQGTDGEFRTNRTTGINIPGVLNTGEAYGNAVTKTNNGNLTARTASGIAMVNLGDGQVILEGVRAVADVTKFQNGTYRFRNDDTKISRLVVGGEEVPVPEDGESMEIPGLGSLQFNVVTERRGGYQVIAALLTLLDESGATIEVPIGVASAYIR